jgi:flagellar biogenesis protein FliO
MEWIVLKTLLSLAAVIGLMIVVVVLMKKFMYGGKASAGNIVDMKIVGTMMLQPKRSVSLLKVMDKVLIIGVTEAGMETLGEINDEKSIQQIEEQLATNSVPPKWFAKADESVERISFVDALTLQMRKLKTRG